MSGKSKWTPERDDLFIQNWAKLSILELCELFGVDKTTIYRRATYWRGIGVNCPKKTGKIDENCPRPKQRVAAPIEQKPAVQPSWSTWLGSAEYKARLMGGR